MKSISGKEFCKILEKKGWILRRIHGSHHIYTKTSINYRISVPIHGNQSLKLGLLKHLLKIANIDEDDL